MPSVVVDDSSTPDPVDDSPDDDIPSDDAIDVPSDTTEVPSDVDDVPSDVTEVPADVDDGPEVVPGPSVVDVDPFDVASAVLVPVVDGIPVIVASSEVAP